MRFKTTARAIREGYGRILRVGYRELQSLFSCESPIAYASGVYGWNFDVYAVPDYDGACICTGYRGMPGVDIPYELAKAYEKKAHALECKDFEAYKAKKRALIVELFKAATKEKGE